MFSLLILLRHLWTKLESFFNTYFQRQCFFCQYSLWKAVTFGAAKFQVDSKEEEGEVWPECPVGIRWGESEYVDGPLIDCLFYWSW